MDEQDFTPVPAAEQSAEVAPVEQQAVEPVSGTPTPETQQTEEQTDEQQRERVADASRVMREQKERNRAAAERRTRDAAEAQAWRQQRQQQHRQALQVQAQVQARERAGEQAWLQQMAHLRGLSVEQMAAELNAKRPPSVELRRVLYPSPG